MSPLVDQLVSLMALDMNDTVDLKRVADIIARENAVGKGTKNGIQKYLDLHGYFKLESTERMFDGNELLQRKGYVKEITNPNIGFEIVDPVTARRMEKKMVIG